MPLRALITRGTKADCTQAERLIKGMSAAKGYDSDAIVAQAKGQGMVVVIPLRKNRTTRGRCDEDVYKARHLVENAFLHLKRWRGIATRYAKTTAAFLAAVQIRCIALWANVL